MERLFTPHIESASRLRDLRRAYAFVQIHRDAQNRALRYRGVKIPGIDDVPQRKYE
jgi:hypothetical protein